MVPLSACTDVSAQLASWMSQCPDRDAFNAAIARFVALQQKTECGGCGEELLRMDLRFDFANPTGDESTLVCRACWDCWNSGTLGDPDYRPPAWPLMPDIDLVPAEPVDGLLYCTKTNKIIGCVQGYNERAHYARRVTLNGLPNCAEGGSLDADCVVLPYQTVTVSLTDF